MLRLKQLIVAIFAITFLTSCGGGGGGSSVTTPISTVSGVVSDGPIENALVYIDLNLNGQFDATEPHDYTDADGKYSIQVILDNEQEYVVIVEGSTDDYGTRDEEDNPGEDLTFTMFNTFQTSGLATADENIGKQYNVNVNPTLFRDKLIELDEEIPSSTISGSLSTFLNDEETDETLLFQTYINSVTDSSENDNSSTTIFGTINALIEETTEKGLISGYVETQNDLVETEDTSAIYLDIENENENITLSDIVDGSGIFEIYGANSLVRTDVAYDVIADSSNEDNSDYLIYNLVDIDDNISRVTFKKRNSSESIPDGIENSLYEGTVTFDRTTKDIIFARYYQDLTLTSLGIENKLSGYLTIYADGSETKFTFEKGIYSFPVNFEPDTTQEIPSIPGTYYSDGVFYYIIETTNSCNPSVYVDGDTTNDSAVIKGKITIKDAVTEKSMDEVLVNNTITSASATTSNIAVCVK